MDRVILIPAMEEYPGLGHPQCPRRLDIRTELLFSRNCEPWDFIESVNGVLISQEGMHGNSED